MDSGGGGAASRPEHCFSGMEKLCCGWIAATLAKSADVAPRSGPANIPVADSAVFCTGFLTQRLLRPASVATALYTREPSEQIVKFFV